MSLVVTLGPLALLLHSWWWLVLIVPMVIVGASMLRTFTTSMWAICPHCGWSGFVHPGKSDGGPPAFGAAGRPLGWFISDDLARAVRDEGLSGLAFVLDRIAFDDGDMTFWFTAEQAVSPGKAKEAGLALRCVVGLTFLAAIQKVREISIEDDRGFRVRLGDGVLLTAPKLRSGSDVTDYLQVVSDHGGDFWSVTIKPITVLLNNRDHQAAMQQSILAQLRPLFEPLCGMPVTLQG